MKNKLRIRELCQNHTLLSDKDIKEIEIQAHKIIENKSYPNVDVFIDVFDFTTGEAIVVFQRPPLEGESLYSRNILGERMERKNEPAIYRSYETSLNSVGLLGKTPDGINIRQIVYPIRNNKKNIAVLIIEEKFEGSVEQLTLPDAEKSFNGSDYLIDKIEQGILHFNNNGTLIKANAIARNMYRDFGYLGEIIGLHYDNLSIDFSTFEHINYLINSSSLQDDLMKEVFFHNSYFEIKYIFSDDGAFIMLILDITELKQRDVEIVDKSVAIREIHHRVKNNLQTVISLLRIQSRMTPSEEAKKALIDSVNRIMAIASTHELLSRQLEDNIELKQVLFTVINNLRRGYTDQQLITISSDIEEGILLPSDLTVTVSLVVNELVQNCFDHAFEGLKTGEISLEIYSMENSWLHLLVRDNGIGYDTTVKKEGSFGMEIIKSYVFDKLKGELTIESNEHGTMTDIKFKYN